MGIKNFKGKPLQRTWLGTSSGNAVKGNMPLICFIIFLPVWDTSWYEKWKKKICHKKNTLNCNDASAKPLLLLQQWENRNHDGSSVPVEEGPAGGHVSMCLAGFAVVLSAYIWIFLRHIVVQLNISAGLCSCDVTTGEIVPELHCVHVHHLISTFRFQTTSFWLFFPVF